MSAALVSSDLLITSHVAAAGTRQSIHVKSYPTTERLLAALPAEPVRLVILDVAMANLDFAALLPQLRAAAEPPLVIAFGPHMHADRLAVAREAGCDRVMPRSKFHAKVDEWLKLAQE